MQTKPGFTDFRCFTPSLGKLQKFCFRRVLCLGKKMLCIKLPNAHQTFKKHKTVIQKMQQTCQKQNITLYKYIYLELAQTFQPEKLTIVVILLCDFIGHVIYKYSSVCQYKNLCFQKKGFIPIFFQ